MLLADSNIWVSLAIARHSHHTVVARWFHRNPKRQKVLFCRSTQQALLRLVTTAAVMAPFRSPPMTNNEAWELYRRLRSDPGIGFTEEPAGLENRWKFFTAKPISTPKLWMDAYLAAFAVAGKHRLITTDTGFRQSPGLDLLALKA